MSLFKGVGPAKVGPVSENFLGIEFVPEVLITLQDLAT